MADTDNGQSIVKNLITKNTPTQQEEDSNVDVKREEELEVEDSSANGKDESEIENSLVTEELVKTLNLPKGFIGKPLSEIGKSYRESLSWGNENNKKLIQLETKLQTLEGQLSQSQIKNTEEAATKETEEKLGEAPDPVEDPKGFKAWLSKRDSLIEEKITKILENKLDNKSKELLKSVDDNPILKQAQEIAAERTESMIYEKIQEALPKTKDGKETMKANDVLDAWFEDNEEDYAELVKSGVYKNRPEKLVRDVLTWLKAQSYDSLKNQKESEIIKKIHSKTKENLESLGKKTKTQFQTQPRKTGDEGKETVVSRIVEKLQAQKRLSMG